MSLGSEGNWPTPLCKRSCAKITWPHASSAFRMVCIKSFFTNSATNSLATLARAGSSTCLASISSASNCALISRHFDWPLAKVAHVNLGVANGVREVAVAVPAATGTASRAQSEMAVKKPRPAEPSANCLGLRGPLGLYKPNSKSRTRK